MHRWLYDFKNALTLLTVLPVPGLRRDELEAEQATDCARSTRLFPLVGALVGLILVGVDAAATLFFSPGVRAALLVAAAAAVSGGLHLDGLADTFDGLLCRKDRETTLQIMRDSRMGALGATALIISLLLRFALLDEVADWLRPYALLFLPIAGRQAMVLAIALHGYARSGAGMGRQYALQTGRREVYASLMLTGLMLTAGWLQDAAAGAGRFVVIAVAVVAAQVGSAIFARHVAGRLGGLTGDVYGAVNEVAELVFLLVVAVVH